jgi:hypothetical protein
VISMSCTHGFTHPAPGNESSAVRFFVVIRSTLPAESMVLTAR